MTTEIEKLEQDLVDLRSENLSAWNIYGSELCAGEMLKKERELEDKIEQLKLEN